MTFFISIIVTFLYFFFFLFSSIPTAYKQKNARRKTVGGITASYYLRMTVCWKEQSSGKLSRIDNRTCACASVQGLFLIVEDKYLWEYSIWMYITRIDIIFIRKIRIEISEVIISKRSYLSIDSEIWFNVHSYIPCFLLLLIGMLKDKYYLEGDLLFYYYTVYM